jgi:mRNA interferase HigB
MKLVGRNRLDEFCVRYPDARAWIENWIADVEAATWTTPHYLKARYPSASLLGGGVAIFNVKGNDYRLEATIAYKTSTVVVLWTGTHTEYDKRNKRR